MNKVILLGRLTKDPTTKGATKFTVAVNKFKKEDGADFINCVAFGKTGETIAQYLTKGRQIALEGRIVTGSYDKEGQKVYTTEVAVDRFEFVSEGKQQVKGGFDSFNDMTPDDGDIPF